MNFDFLLTNPELAKNIKFEITGENLLELSATLINSAKEQSRIDLKDEFITIDEACSILKRDRSTLFRWKKSKILVSNQLGLYKKSDIDKFLEKK